MNKKLIDWNAEIIPGHSIGGLKFKEYNLGHFSNTYQYYKK